MKNDEIYEIRPNFFKSRFFSIIFILIYILISSHTVGREYNDMDYFIVFIIIAALHTILLSIFLYIWYFTYKHRVLTIDSTKTTYKRIY